MRDVSARHFAVIPYKHGIFRVEETGVGTVFIGKESECENYITIRILRSAK